jgi:hypothetical protein
MILKTKLLAALAILTLSTFCIFAARASAFDLFGSPCSDVKAKNSAACVDSAKAQSQTAHNNVVLNTIQTAANILAFLGGVVAVLVIIISGLTFVLSGGNNEEVTNARRRIIYAAAGLAIIALAWTIISFVLQKVL